MFSKISIFLTLLILVTVSHAARAQTAMENAIYTKEIKELNHSNPLQRGDFEKSHDILKRTIMDDTNKTLGDVTDIILTNEGTISALNSTLDRLKVPGVVALNYTDMDVKAANNGYILGFEDEEVEDLLPTLLAGIATASGSDGNFALTRLLGGKVASEDGRIIGKVEDVLFEKQGSHAAALYIDVNHKTLRGRGVAVPFGSLTYLTAQPKVSVLLNPGQADAILKAASEY